MKINYCLPIIKKTKEEVIKAIDDNMKDYDYFEVWLDYVSDFDEEFIDDLCNQLKDRLIFLFRRKNLERIKMNLGQRKDIIKFLSKNNSYLDLDITQKEELDFLESNNIKMPLIISYHNYKQTPSKKKLSEIIEEIILHKPSILKISCFCNTNEDAISLLVTLSELKRKNIKFIVSGMGEFGTMVKVQGALLGNEMTFAPLSENETSAPGQITKHNLERIITLIRNS